MAVAETSNINSQPSRALTSFRILSLLSVLSVFALVILGAVVRVTGSGLGCPDWPLCHGGLLPPLESKAVIEYSHRIVASLLVGPLVLATSVVALLAFRRERWLVVPAVLALLLLLAQAMLGGATVLSELPGAVVAAHLALGEALLACLILVAVVAYRGPLELSASRSLDGRPDRFPILALTAGVAVYALLITGSLVTVSGATGACLDWPLCQGEVFPSHKLQAIHMGHRIAAAIIGLFVMFALHIAIRQKHRPAFVRFLAMGIAALFVTQVMIGAAAVWLKFPVEVKALHQGVATAVWGTLAALAIISLTRWPLSRGDQSRA